MEVPDQFHVSRKLTLGLGFRPIYQVRPGFSLTIKNLTLSNTLGLASIVQVCYVRDDAVPNQNNAILWNVSIPAISILPLPVDQILYPNFSIQALAFVTPGVNLFLSGIEEEAFRI